MFDLGATEMLVIGIVALVVVGPKDLPVMFKTIGRYVGIARSKLREFSSEIDAAADDAGLKSVQSELEDIAGSNGLVKSQGKKASSWGPLAAATPPAVSDVIFGDDKAEEQDKVAADATELAS